jgi:hypothetical protein
LVWSRQRVTPPIVQLVAIHVVPLETLATTRMSKPAPIGPAAIAMS